MTLVQRLGVRGLWPDPNPHTDAPKGGLLEAAEVVIRRKGVAEPRPGFKDGSAIGDLDNLKRLIPHGASSTYIAVGTDGGVTETFWSNGTEFGPSDDSAFSWDSPDNVRGCTARDSTYLTTNKQVYKAVAPGSNVERPSGVIPPSLYRAQTSGAGTAVENGYSVAYRAIIERTAGNGMIVSSSPSGRAVYKNDSGATANVTVTYTWRDGHTSSATIVDHLKIYRTHQTTSDTPGDEYFLAGTIELTDNNGSQVDFTDVLTDARLGEPLYTNSSVTGGGITRANVRPPSCKDLGFFQGSMFFARITNFARAVLRYTEGGDVSGAATGIGRRTFTGRRTNTSANISNMSSQVGLKVGMVLSDTTNWGGGSVPVRLVAFVDATTVQVSQLWETLSDGSDVSLTFCDAIVIGSTATSTNYYRCDTLKDFIQGVNAGLAAGSGEMQKCTTAFALGTGEDTRRVGTTLQNDRRSVSVEAIFTSATLSIAATHGSEFDPPLIEPATGSSSFAPQSIANGIAWSKTDQPEHAMLAAQQRIGTQSSSILRILPTRDAIWILKGVGDGVHRLTGLGETTGWRIDPFDADTYLLHPELACAHDHEVFAWTNKGLVSISDAGVIPISDALIDGDLADLEYRLHTGVTGPGVFAVANQKGREVIFGLPSLTSASGSYDGSVRNVYCFNVKNKALTKWFSGVTTLTCGIYADRLLVFGRSSNAIPFIERDADETVRNADQQYSVTINSISGNTITIAAASGWTPAVGDLLVRSSVYGIVTSITSATVFEVHDSTGMSTGAGTGYVAYECRVGFLNEAADAPAALKEFTEVIAHWEDTRGVRKWNLELKCVRDHSLTATQTYDVSYQRSSQVRSDYRALVPADIARTTQMFVTLAIKQADARFRLAGYSADFNITSTRVNP